MIVHPQVIPSPWSLSSLIRWFTFSHSLPRCQFDHHDPVERPNADGVPRQSLQPSPARPHGILRVSTHRRERRLWCFPSGGGRFRLARVRPLAPCGVILTFRPLISLRPHLTPPPLTPCFQMGSTMRYPIRRHDSQKALEPRA